ncbi:MAG: hypothetical protein K0S55_976, partial [Clostridia bacterium]|nr:hypothetical protein [Clostridia bacterium]
TANTYSEIENIILTYINVEEDD